MHNITYRVDDGYYVGDPTIMFTDNAWHNILEKTNYLNDKQSFYPHGVAVNINNDVVINSETKEEFYIPSHVIAVVRLHLYSPDKSITKAYNECILQTIHSLNHEPINFYEEQKLVGKFVKLTKPTHVVVNKTSLLLHDDFLRFSFGEDADNE